MKRVITVCLAALMAVLLAASCQATPEKPVVMQKDMQQMIEKAQLTSGVQSSGTQTLRERLGAPERLEMEDIKSAKGTFTVTTDADMYVPDVNGMPSVRVGKHAFTQEEASRITDVLFEGQHTYSGDILLSKQNYQDRILEFQRTLVAETDEQKRQELQGSIDKFKGVMDTLPEGEGLIETAPAFTEQNGVSSIYVVSDGADGHYRTLSILSDPKLGSYSVCYLCGENGYTESTNFYNARIDTELRHGREAGGAPEAIPDPEITPEQALGTADGLVSNLGFENFECRQNELVFGLYDGRWVKAYALEYTREIGGAPITYVNADADGAVDDGRGGYIEGWGYERLSLLIGDGGVLRAEINNPYDLGDTVTEDTTLLPFDSIADTYMNMILITNEYTGVSSELCIDRVTLGLARITDSSTRGMGIVVPAWDFFGTFCTKDENGEKSVLNDPAGSRLTINAIDGTVIDRGLGY